MALDERDVAPAFPCEVIERGGADDTAADHDHTRVGFHRPLSLRSSWSAFRRHALGGEFGNGAFRLLEMAEAHAPQNVIGLGELDVCVGGEFHPVAPGVEKIGETARQQLHTHLFEPGDGSMLVVDRDAKVPPLVGALAARRHEIDELVAKVDKGGIGRLPGNLKVEEALVEGHRLGDVADFEGDVVDADWTGTLLHLLITPGRDNLLRTESLLPQEHSPLLMGPDGCATDACPDEAQATRSNEASMSGNRRRGEPRERGGSGARRALRNGRFGTTPLPDIQRNVPVFDVLSDEGLEIIENNAEVIMEEVGIAIKDDPEAIAMWRDAGADVANDG